MNSSIIELFEKRFSSSPIAYLDILERETHLRFPKPHMVSGKNQGRFLAAFAKAIKANLILELGTFTGYSALCLAEGVSENGKVFSIEQNPEIAFFAKDFIAKTPLSGKIEILEGKVDAILPLLDYYWDLIFIDADKPSYANYFRFLAEKLKVGGCIIADNIFWHGVMLSDEYPKTDKNSKGILDFLELTKTYPNFIHTVIPMRDGLLMSVKVS